MRPSVLEVSPYIVATLAAIAILVISTNYSNSATQFNQSSILADDSFRTSIIAAIFTSLPIIGDTLSAVLYRSYSQLEISKEAKYFLISLSAPSFISTIPYIVLLGLSVSHNGIAVPCLLGIQELFTVAHLLRSIQHFEGIHIWSASSVAVILLFYNLGYVLLYIVTVSFYSQVILVIGCILFYGSTIYMLVNMYLTLVRTFSPVAIEKAHSRSVSASRHRSLSSIYFALFFIQQLAPSIVWWMYAADAAKQTVNQAIVSVAVRIFILAAVSVARTKVLEAEVGFYSRSLAMKNVFVRQMSHEIRNPLNVSCIGLEMLQHDLENEAVDPKITCALQDIAENCNLAIEIVNEMLIYDKLAEGKYVLEKKLMSVSELVHDCCKPFFYLSRRNEVQLSVLSSESEEAIKGIRLFVDENKIKQILRNFLSNAIKFTPPGGRVSVCALTVPLPSRLSSTNKSASSTFRQPTSAATVGVEEDNCAVRIEVHDTGAGIDKQHQSSLFQEYFQVDAAKLQKGGGSGLGLSIAKSIALMHGGLVGMESEGAGHGAVFFVELPARKIDPTSCSHPTSASSDVYSQNSVRRGEIAFLPAIKELEERRSSKESAMRHSGEVSFFTQVKKLSLSKLNEVHLLSIGLHVLVVDDALSNRKILCRLLQRDGHSFDEAADGAEACQMVATSMGITVEVDLDDLEDGSGKMNPRSFGYDAIYMDYSMPKLDGPDACEQIRRLGYRGVIVGVTGNTMPAEVEHFISKGATFVLAKPLTMKIFRESITGNKF